MARLYVNENFPWRVVELSEHAGIIVYTQDADTEGQAQRIHTAIIRAEMLRGQLLRINRPQR